MSMVTTMRHCLKAAAFTRRSFLNSLISHTPNSTMVPSIGLPPYLHKSYWYEATIPPSISLFHRNYAKYSEQKTVELQIISRENIKPSSPTPHDLRTFKLSFIDQFYFDYYTPLILFLPGSIDHNRSVSDVISLRSRRLKESLSDLLTRFYPFAGEIKDHLHIECNDKGIYYVEARVNQTLEEFLRERPEDRKLRKLLPIHPSTNESSLRKHVASVQVNIFKCGGIGLSTSMSHKIVDGHSYVVFMKAWAETARGSTEITTPSFLASEIFPNNPSLKFSLPSKLRTTKATITKRFVFDSTALASLKAQIVANTTTGPSPTRIEAISALLWKVAAKVAMTVRPFSPQSPHALCLLVNIRKRSSPPFPNKSIGNLVDAAIGVCFPKAQLELSSLVSEIREIIAKKDSDYIESLKGEKGHATFDELFKTANGLFDAIDEGDCLIVTSMLNSGIYDIDFGWGKPLWFYLMNAENPRIVALSDTVKRDGVEVVVSLSPEEMEIFERDPDILLYTTANPTPIP